MATKSTPNTTEPTQPVSQPTPSHGGSYLVNEQTGEHQLVERTQPSAGRQPAATTETKE